MKRPLLADVINVCTPIQNIQIIDKTTNNEYGDHEIYIMQVHRETLIIVIKP